MNVKLMQGLAGTGFEYAPRMVIKCSDRQGERFISEGVGVEAAPGAEVDGEFFDRAPEEKVAPRRTPEKAIKRAPETPEKGKEPATCAGTTTAGFSCKRAPVSGSEFCKKHQEG